MSMTVLRDETLTCSFVYIRTTPVYMSLYKKGITMLRLKKNLQKNVLFIRTTMIKQIIKIKNRMSVILFCSMAIINLYNESD